MFFFYYTNCLMGVCVYFNKTLYNNVTLLSISKY